MQPAGASPPLVRHASICSLLSPICVRKALDHLNQGIHARVIEVAVLDIVRRPFSLTHGDYTLARL